MSEFPKDFTPLKWLQPEFDQATNQALQRLQSRGYEVASGLNEYWAEVISQLAQQPHIVEYCPADYSSTRFVSPQSARRWLAEKAGRAVFLLFQMSSPQEELVGYAWTGYDTNAPSGYPLTSAYRLATAARGRGLAKDYISVVLGATETLFSQEGLGLQTWESNPALKIYQQLGFEILRHGAQELRPTLQPTKSGQVADRRIYMGLNRFSQLSAEGS